MRKRFALLLLALILALSGCADMINDEEPGKIPIGPMPEAGRAESLEIGLLYKYRGAMLSPETRTLDITASERMEAGILKELIRGPSKDHIELQAAIHPDTRVISVKDMGEYLEVTLSKEFLYPVAQKDTTELTAKEKLEQGLLSQKLAVFSVVNTLIQNGSASRVHILVDVSGSGTGERVTRKQLGMYGDEQDELSEPLAYDPGFMTTPNRIAELFFSAVSSKNWDEACSYVAYDNQRDESNVNCEEITGKLSESSGTILDATLTLANVSSGGQSALLLADYSYQSSGQSSGRIQGFPIRMIQRREIWKISYSSFAELLGLSQQ